MAVTDKTTPAGSLFLLICLALLTGCGGSARPDPPAPPVPVPLSAANVNLIFVVSEDVAFQSAGDVNPATANLTNRGLQRSLMMATFLKRQVLGTKNVTSVYAIEPMTHLQTSRRLPDIVAMETAQQFAVLNQITLSGNNQVISPYTANSYPLNVSYSTGPVPRGVAPPLLTCADCQGLDFADQNGDNEVLVNGIVKANVPGFYVFSAPSETTSTLLTKINQIEGYNLTLPASYTSPDYVYAISIAPSGSASLVTYNASLNPTSSYPAMPPPGIVASPCKAKPFSIKVTGGSNGAVVPAGTNTSETMYMVRHAEAHPINGFEDGNYVCAGQWRALNLPNALAGKILPDEVYSIDPAQVLPGGTSPAGQSRYSYVRTVLTVEPYAIANNLPYGLAASFEMIAQNPPQLSTVASDFFFNGGQFSNHTVLVGWEHDHIPPTVNALLASYHDLSGQTAPDWPDDDYDTIWTITLDAYGNLTVDNNKCEGMNSEPVAAACPQF